MNDVVLVRHASASAATSGPSRRHMIAGSVLKVYTTLQRLERDGLVEAGGHGEGAQKGYRLTAPGRTELLGWLQRPSGDDTPPRDELLIMVLVAVQVSEVDVHEVIQTHRRHLIETMQRYTAVRVATDAGRDDGSQRTCGPAGGGAAMTIELELRNVSKS